MTIKKEDFDKEVAKLYFDFAKLIFGGVILSTVLDIDSNKLLVLFVGIIAVSLLLVAGFLKLKR